jgi:molybdopterin/thiamine biosynthesis adenylyltransferase
MSEKLITEIQAASRALKRPDGEAYQSIAVTETDKIAAAAGVSGRDVEVAALEGGIIPERYTRNLTSLSPRDQINLLQATVAVVGLGGLGGTVTEMLARMGIGRLKLIDGDVFEDSNLNRQITSSVNTIGRSKADVARERVLQINAGLHVETRPLFLEEQNAAELIEGADVVVDCLDSLTSRYTLAVACRKSGAPLVVAAVAGLSGR